MVAFIRRLLFEKQVPSMWIKLNGQWMPLAYTYRPRRGLKKRGKHVKSRHAS